VSLLAFINPVTQEMLMMQPSFLRLALAFATLTCLACLPVAAGAVEINDIFAFKGTATDIGVQRGPGQIGGIEYRIEGKFDYDGPLDLTRSTVTFHHFLDEHLPGGNGEMLLTTDNADLVCPEPNPGDCVATLAPLLSSSSSKPNEGKYETFRFRPPMRVQIKNKAGVYQFNVRLDRGTSPQVLLPGGPTDAHLLPADRQFPKLCGVDPADKSKRATTDIRTGFTIDDGVNEPVVLDFVKAWECSQPGRYHLRSR
jgi:hypothetical protein